MKNENARKRSGLRKALTGLCIVLALVLAVMVAGTVFAQSLLNRVNRIEGTENTLTQEELDQLLQQEDDPTDPNAPTVDAGDVQWQEHSTQIGQIDGIVNILLIGQDRRPGEGRTRSDTMILCTFNTEKKTLTMTSFLRDLYVQIPGYADAKLNAAYPAGGMALLDETLKKNFGVHVDGNVEVDFTNFAKIIDLLGGVDMELREDEAAYINKYLGKGSLTSGTHTLTGEQATMYSRIRKLDADSDFSRTNRQRKVLTSLINKFKDTDLSTMLKLVTEILPMITTDMSNAQILGYATELFPMLSGAEVISQRIPQDGTYTLPMINRQSVVLADMDAARKFLEETLGTID